MSIKLSIVHPATKYIVLAIQHSENNLGLLCISPNRTCKFQGDSATATKVCHLEYLYILHYPLTTKD